MVTNVPYYSFKVARTKRSVPFPVIVMVALMIGLVALYTYPMLFAIFIGYGLSGYVIYVWRKATGRQTSVISTSTDEPDERGLH